MILAIAVLSLSGLIVGWQIDSSLGDAVGGYVLLILFAVVMIWIGTLVGLVSRSADAVMGPAFLIVFPLTFLGEHVRSDRRPARRPAPDRRVEPGQRPRRGDP